MGIVIFFFKDLQTPAPDSGSAPKQETLTPRRRMTIVAEFQKTSAKESKKKKKLADAIRRKTFAAGTMNGAVRQSTVTKIAAQPSRADQRTSNLRLIFYRGNQPHFSRTLHAKSEAAT